MAGDPEAGLSAIAPRAVLVAVLAHPSLWLTAVRQVLRLATPGWWRWWRRRAMPAPDTHYLRFRLETAYGDADRPPEPDDVLAYLRWCRAWPG